MSRARRRRRLWLWVLLPILTTAILYTLILYVILTLPRGEDRHALKIYSAAYALMPGSILEKQALVDRLNHLGYRPVYRKLQAPGEYRLLAGAVDIYLRDFAYPDGFVPGRPVRLMLEEHRIVKVVSLPDEQDAGPVSLEPQLIGGVVEASRQVREWIPLASIPAPVIDAVLAIEDHRFYQHIGLDPVGIARAAWQNLKGGGVVQGGSTITQQLAKNLYYTQHRTMVRKLKEALAALILEMKYSKPQILESYLNEIYLGQSGSVAIYGVGEAAHYYFGKSLAQLAASEAALLAGMIKGPNTYAPVRNPKGAKQRRDLVLLRMKQEGKLTDKQYQAAVASPIRTASLQHGLADAPYFMDYILSAVDEETESTGGLRLFTTLDLEMQRVAEQAVTGGLARLQRRYKALRTDEDHLQAALVAIDPRTGGILAMVGGRDYRASQFNHAVQARRQAGSLFKPFVYLAAFERSLQERDGALTAATLLDDSPLTFPQDNGSWSPQNYDRQFHGQVSVRTAIEQSFNVPAVRVAQTVGVAEITRLLRSVGIQGPLDEHLSLALGTSEVSLLEITAAFAALARGGEYVAPTGLHALVEQGSDRSSRPAIAPHTPTPVTIASPQATYLITSILQGVLQRGTAAAARALGITGAVAGKTGTTDDHRDAWFIGYTPDIVVGVWVGFDEGTTLTLTGAQAALPIWAEFFRKAAPLPPEAFPIPAGMVSRTIDPQTGQLATSACPQSAEEWFIEGTEPMEFCERHSPGMIQRLKDMFGL